MAIIRKINCIFQYPPFLIAMVFVWSLILLAPSLAQKPITQAPFRFETFQSLDDMHTFIVQTFPLGSSRDSLRHTFVEEAQATLKTHPTQAGVEKYIYDVNLCGYYVWRWNISADYDANGKLLQAYLNANPIFKEGKPKRVTEAKAPSGQKASIVKAIRSRPEAVKGESKLAYLLLDRDTDLKTMDDQSLIGSGPSRADPLNMGKLVTYTDVEPWRSIFDADDTNHIAAYPDECAKVDTLIQQRTR